MSTEVKKIRVGSRKSELALIQTRHVISRLKQSYNQYEFEIVTMSTLGDKVLDIPLPKIGEKSLFTQELETALKTGCVDFVVHSLKDLPTALPEGMAIGAVLAREDPRDALVLNKDYKNCSLDTLPEGSVIGTSSLRRAAQLARKYPHLKVESIRGNLNTRLKKLDELGKYHAVILAAAGLIRMGWHSRISQILEKEDLLYAVGQGALAVECRSDDEETINLLKPLYDVKTAFKILAERSFLKTLGGGCSAPVAVCTNLCESGNKQVEINLTGAVWSLDGKAEILESQTSKIYVGDIQLCANCPYNTSESITTVEDIECLKKCDSCPLSPTKEVPKKKAKLTEIPKSVLEVDPHDSCPVKIPVGADFMGKCPYLESNFFDDFSADNADEFFKKMRNKCPVITRRVTTEAPSISEISLKQSSKENDIPLFCGLVSHTETPLRAFKQIEDLGKQLAQTLIGKGAIEIMSKAQAIVRGDGKH